ncbi:DUF6153 family protein [Saccharothrix variisporea]|uniref:DUF6153 family protein n=1 Tax=Saccharothrix variisporea TaxID=543527 RepID=UPI000EABEA85|nr:DUF6153 family protein [Saccharothrix variisporea]
MVTRASALRWVLVWAVALALVGMHHLSTHPSGDHTTTSATVMAADECCSHATENAPTQDSGHDMLHLCLAILSAALVLALALLTANRPVNRNRIHALSVARLRAPPPPPRGTPALLANLCVLRL